MKREIREFRRRLWRDMTGCECKRIVKGKPAPKDDVCTPEAIRCNRRMNRVVRDYEKHGLKVGPVAPGESGLAAAGGAGT